jgi:hypothetical protein
MSTHIVHIIYSHERAIVTLTFIRNLWLGFACWVPWPTAPNLPRPGIAQLAPPWIQRRNAPYGSRESEYQPMASLIGKVLYTFDPYCIDFVVHYPIMNTRKCSISYREGSGLRRLSSEKCYTALVDIVDLVVFFKQYYRKDYKEETFLLEGGRLTAYLFKQNFLIIVWRMS